MAVLIRDISPGSPAAAANLRPGELLVAVNGHPIADVLDYRFYTTERNLLLLVRDADVLERAVRIQKGTYEDLGLTFETYLMDQQRGCRNKCVFCFIDQLPGGLRDSLYFKDDDARLSFLFGNYITLTNLTDREVDRIIEMRLSPVNVSVHTTDPALRVRMMGNPHAGEVLSTLPRLAAAGIHLNCQLVLCPGLNDGDALAHSLNDLAALAPAVQSIAVVPVGLTKHRANLPPLRAFTAESASAVIDLVEARGDEYLNRFGTRLCYPADEFYIKAVRPIPDAAFYEEFAQLENGVGLMALLREEFMDALYDAPPAILPRSVTIATGVAAAPLITSLVDAAQKRWHNLDCTVAAVPNHFWGTSVDVAGLITGGDLVRVLTEHKLGEELLIPSVMLRREGDLFLDDMTPEQVSRRIGRPVRPITVDGKAFVRALGAF